MLKKLKKYKKLHKNQGNTFIMVIVSLSFLAVLTSALLVAVALCYRMKSMDINSRDNFYYLEQAMDEIYAGVGADSISKLNKAYTETLEVIVYYDTESKSYVTMNNEVANKIMKKSYMKLVKSDPDYSSKDKVLKKLASFMSCQYQDGATSSYVQRIAGDPTSGEKFQVQVQNAKEDYIMTCELDNVDLSTKAKDNLTILNLQLTRTAHYSNTTVGARGKDAATGGKDTFTQTISTDLVIGTPEFDVSFNTIDASLSDMFSFSMITDKGLEVINSKVNITGDVYAASDFYNKDYNGTTNKGIDVSTANVTAKRLVASGDATNDGSVVDNYKVAISSYGVTGTSDTRFSNRDDGTLEQSMYSGVYMSNSDVVITANKLVVPGSIAAMNSSQLTVSGINGNRIGKTDIWTDSIILGGYAMKKGGDELTGSNVTLNANCYVSDDLEVNATNSRLTLIGTYYGYNNSTTDTRSFSRVFLEKNKVFKNNWDDGIVDGAVQNAAGYQAGQAHYNSSSIVINGQNAALDLKDVSALYVAGQAYIELSKDYTEKELEVDKDGVVQGEVRATASGEAGKASSEDNEVVTAKTYTYDSDGFTANSDRKYQAIQDYKTGEAISIKSNQLAYIPPGALQEEDDGNGNIKYYVTLPEALLTVEPFCSTWDNPRKAVAEAISKIPVVKTEIKGNVHYYFDFASADTTNKNINEFIAAYSKIFEDGSAASEYLNNITDYENFQVDMLRLPTKPNVSGTDYTKITDYSKIFSNSALTVKAGNTFHIEADSKAVSALIAAADAINEKDAEQVESDGTTTPAKTITIASDASGNVTASEKQRVSLAVSNNLRKQYKEMKLLLSASSSDSVGVEVASQIDESAITPINHFFKFSVFDAANSKITDKTIENLDKSGYGVWLNEGDVKVGNDGSGKKALKGIVICKGDVTFGTEVSSFEGIIVTGGKIIVTHDIDFIANEEVIKSVLRICEDNSATGNEYEQILSLFRSYSGGENDNTTVNVDHSESTKTISTIQFEDIIEFSNWKKNVN